MPHSFKASCRLLVWAAVYAPADFDRLRLLAALARERDRCLRMLTVVEEAGNDHGCRAAFRRLKRLDENVVTTVRRPMAYDRMA